MLECQTYVNVLGVGVEGAAAGLERDRWGRSSSWRRLAHTCRGDPTERGGCKGVAEAIVRVRDSSTGCFLFLSLEQWNRPGLLALIALYLGSINGPFRLVASVRFR
jgi:hypothetical protein